MEMNQPPLEIVLREWENKFFGLEQNGKKYIGKDFIMVCAVIDKQLQTVYIEIRELLEQSDFTVEEFVAINTIWLLSVDEYAKVRKFVDDWVDWCEINDYSLEFVC